MSTVKSSQNSVSCVAELLNFHRQSIGFANFVRGHLWMVQLYMCFILL